MELKIGEIRQINNEWYQCVEGNGCGNCAFEGRKCYLYNDTDDPIGECCYDRRRDNRDVIFKKLEKLGEPFERNGYMYQEYKARTYPLLMSGGAKMPTANGFAVIIKQNKEDMEEKKQKLDKLVDDYMACRIQYAEFDKEIKALYTDKEVSNLRLKEFDLEAAKAGKPVCTRNGRKARIICFDAKDDNYPLVVAVMNSKGKEDIIMYTSDGHFYKNTPRDDKHDLLMLSEKKEGWVNVYYDNDTSSHRGCRFIYNTKEQAIKSAGDTYVVREKKQGPLKTWEEFCKRYPIKKEEFYIDTNGEVISARGDYSSRNDKNWCTSEEEAEAFLALMQLRQLRKAWVGDWEPNYVEFSIIVYHINRHKIIVDTGNWSFNYPLTFPTEKMAKDFLNCFRDLCETAKILL